MRVAVWHDPPPGGARRAIDEVLRRLVGRHEIDLYRLGDSAPSFGDEAVATRVEVVSVESFPHRRFALYWNDWLTYQSREAVRRREWELAERIDRSGYDVALVSVLRWGQAPSILRYLRTPNIYYCHEPPRRFYEPWCRPEAAPLSHYERARLLWRRPAQALLDSIVKRQDRASVQQATRVLTNSRYTRERIRQVYGRDAAVCYLGVDSDRFRPPTEVTSGGVISVGALETHKGFDFVIRALGRVSERYRPTLTIVGSGGHPAMPGYLRRLAAEVGVRLTIRSGVSDRDLVALYQNSCLFVFGARFEPFGLVLLEAMACGLPIVAVAEGGVPEIVRDGQTGYLVPRDEAMFAAAVERLIADAGRRQTMGRAAREVAVSEWSWEDAAARIEEHLKDIAAPHSVFAPVGGS